MGEEAESEPLEIIIAFSYPMVDSILLVPAIIAISVIISNKKSFFWIMILIGILIMVVADDLFLFLVINDSYVDGHPIDILWISSYTIWAFMMFYSIMESRRNEKSDSLNNEVTRNGKKFIDKYGILLSLILINITIIILLFAISYFSNNSESSVQYFSLILVMIVIIFSSMVIIINTKLNKTLQNRTRQLEEISAEMIKVERFTAIGELASRISHDIRNPLSNILMATELMKNSPPETKLDSDMVQERIKLISKNIERISHQINDVLGFVKNRRINKQTFQISSILKESLEITKIPSKIKFKTVNLNVKIDADPFQLQIVFNNLIMNAIQAVGKNKGEICVEAIETDRDLVLEISNSGPAIPKDVLPHIFESLVTTKQVGTGLGLVSCKTVIENHGGSITVKSNPTTFTIRLPKSN